MAGPSASVLADFDGAIPTWRELMSPYAMDWRSGDSCGIANTQPIGGQYHGEPRPFVGSIEPFAFDANEFPDDAALSDAVCKFTNRKFTNSIVVAAMCNQPEDHRILCEVMIHLATILDGIIDFDCLDVPPDTGLRRCEWQFDDVLEWTIIGSPDEARNWLTHRAFRMLK